MGYDEVDVENYVNSSAVYEMLNAVKSAIDKEAGL